jgi:predicted nucleic acid-binding protein
MVLVDANVLLDVLTGDPVWAERSARQLGKVLREGLAINPIIYAELAPGYTSRAALDSALEWSDLQRLPLPYEAGYRAGQAFMAYRKRGGARRSPLPDFYIGAHAETASMRLLTRDATRYQTYFPKLKLITP